MDFPSACPEHGAHSLRILASLLCSIAIASSAYADEVEPVGAEPTPAALDQRIYKGVTGTVLDALPIDADARVQLQRANAIISNPFTARSVAVLLGLSNPVFMVGGLIWGIWAASNIAEPKADMTWLVSDEALGPGFCHRRELKSCQIPFDEHAGETAPERDTLASAS